MHYKGCNEKEKEGNKSKGDELPLTCTCGKISVVN